MPYYRRNTQMFKYIVSLLPETSIYSQNGLIDCQKIMLVGEGGFFILLVTLLYKTTLNVTLSNIRQPLKQREDRV